MDFRILGPLDVLDGGEPVALGGSRQRALLALLLLHAGEAVSSDRLIEALWGDRPTGGARRCRSRSRGCARRSARTAPSSLRTREHGYELRIDARAARRAPLRARCSRRRATSSPRAAPPRRPPRSTRRSRCGAAARSTTSPTSRSRSAEIARLEELRAAALEQRVEARLALGRHAEVVGELRGADRASTRTASGSRAQLMLALYRGDRQADALRAYQDARRSAGRRARHRAGRAAARARARDPRPGSRRWPRRPPPPAAAPRAAAGPRRPAARQRRRRRRCRAAPGADPEALHADARRGCGAVIERHGGSVEPSAGETVVGVFGQTELHEDDALRAARAAVELRDAGADARSASRRARCSSAPASRRGDAFDAAAAARSAAAADGEILLGDGAARLLRGAVEPSATPRRAARRARPRGRGDRPLARGPFVGRARELAQLRAAFERRPRRAGVRRA